MPRFAVIDTEGSGLFKYKDKDGKPVPADAPGQPRLAAFSMILLKDDLSIEEEYHSLVQPDGWAMEPDATAVNGLTDEILRAEGRPVAMVLQVFSQAVAEGFAIAAYNAQHDLKQMRAELRRAGMPDLFEQTPNVCLMRKSNGPIPKKGGKKGWPSLAECRDFLGLDGAKAHQSHTDAHDALAVLMFLHRAGVDLTPDVHYAAGGKPKGGEPAATVADAPISRPRAVQPAVPLAEQELPE